MRLEKLWVIDVFPDTRFQSTELIYCSKNSGVNDVFPDNNSTSAPSYMCLRKKLTIILAIVNSVYILCGIINFDKNLFNVTSNQSIKLYLSSRNYQMCIHLMKLIDDELRH